MRPVRIAAVLVAAMLLGAAAGQFSDTTSQVALGPQSGFRVLAAADWDNDQKVDFVAGGAVNQRLLQVWRWDAGGSRFNLAVNFTMPANVSYAATADLNRDGRVDIVAALANGSIAICFQSASGQLAPLQFADGGSAYLPASVNLVNYNAGCGLPQIYAVRTDGRGDLITPTFGASDGECRYAYRDVSYKVTVFIASGARSFSAAPDLNGDCLTDFIVATEANATSTTLMHIHRSHDVARVGDMDAVSTLPTQSFGAPVFADWSGDGTADMLLPACVNASGHISAACGPDRFNAMVMLRNKVDGASCPNDDCCSGHAWGFDSVPEGALLTSIPGAKIVNLSTCTGASLQPGLGPWISQGAVVRPGDYDDDAILDAVVASSQGPLVLHGQGDGSMGCALLTNILGTTRAALQNRSADPFFFDIDDDGRLDLVTTNTDSAAAYTFGGAVFAFSSNAAAIGNYYLTAMTISGASSSSGTAWGAVVVGASHRFQYTDINQVVHTATATQAVSSAASSLQPLRAHFGLAVTFSYIMNYATGYAVGAERRYNTWNVYLMPNSQIVVVASPTVSPSEWVLKLFLYGQRFMRLVLIAWLTSLGVIGLPVLLMKLREIQHDRRELHKHE